MDIHVSKRCYGPAERREASRGMQPAGHIEPAHGHVSTDVTWKAKGR